MKKLVLPLLVLSSLASLVHAQEMIPSNTSAQELQIYNSLFPTYAEACFGSQEVNLDGSRGGPIGHIFLHVRGLCRDEKSAYPRVTECSGMAPNQSVSVSVDGAFKNVSWVAIDDRDFMFRGNLAENQPLTKQVQEDTINEAVKRGYFKNIEITEDYFTDRQKYPSYESKEKWLARASLGTSFALTFHRHLLCARIPLKQEQLTQIKTYLNGENERYYLHKEIHQWTVLSDNCAHLVHNALAAAGLWQPLQVKAPFPLNLFNMGVPPTEWVRSVYTMNDSWDNLLNLYKQGFYRNEILKGNFHFLFGGTIEMIPVHQFENSVADIDSNFHVFGPPVTGFGNGGPKKRYLTEPQYADLKTNFLRTNAKLQSMLKNPTSLEDYEDLYRRWGRVVPYDFPLFYKAYYQMLKTQSELLKTTISKFSVEETKLQR